MISCVYRFADKMGYFTLYGEKCHVALDIYGIFRWFKRCVALRLVIWWKPAQALSVLKRFENELDFGSYIRYTQVFCRYQKNPIFW